MSAYVESAMEAMWRRRAAYAEAEVRDLRYALRKARKQVAKRTRQKAKADQRCAALAARLEGESR